LGSAGSYTTSASINGLADNAATGRQWCVYLIHALDADSGYSPLSSAVLQASVNYMSTNQNKFWVETFGNVVRYIKERNASSVTEASNSGDAITLQVTNNLDNTIFNYPITIRRPLPSGWPAAVVSQNGKSLKPQLVTVSSVNYVMFDVAPNNGDITLTKTALPPVLSTLTMTPSNFMFRLDGQSNVSYAILSSTDMVNWVSVQTNTLISTFTNFAIDDATNPAGFYRAQWVP
jgi:oligosaccharide reducing-end xylanase